MSQIADCTIAHSFWKSAAHMIKQTEKHEFLVAMVDGSLHVDNFQYYVIQDALYLKDFAACLRMLSQNEGVSENDSKRLMEFAIGAEEAEMSLHNSFFKEWSISADNAVPMPNTLLYASNMIRVCATRPHAEGLASLLPCFWVYMHVGECMLKLREELGSENRRPEYDAWIDMYGGEEFANEVYDYIKMTDAAAKDVSQEVLDNMKEHFLMGVKLEHMFWDQAQNLMSWPKLGESINK